MCIISYTQLWPQNIFFNLQTEYFSDKACYEDAKYPIGFILTSYLKEE